jgi:hypothetical protein
MRINFHCILFLFLLNAGCKSSNKKISIAIDNTTNLNNSSFECFSCTDFLSDKLLSNDESRIVAIDKEAQFVPPHSDYTNEYWFGLLTLKPHKIDSLWMNIELYKVRQQHDTLRFANFGGRSIPNDENTINRIKTTLCKFLNK